MSEVPLSEIRLKGKAGIARAVHDAADEQRVVILRAFIKKTEKTPTEPDRSCAEADEGIEAMTKVAELPPHPSEEGHRLQ